MLQQMPPEEEKWLFEYLMYSDVCFHDRTHVRCVLRLSCFVIAWNQLLI